MRIFVWVEKKIIYIYIYIYMSVFGVCVCDVGECENFLWRENFFVGVYV